jgi:myo-inositol-1(or 4)-monophosphatase
MSPGVTMKFKKIARDLGKMVGEAVNPLVNTAEGRKIVKIGADSTPTRYIDAAAEKCIVDYIDAHELPCTLISEEIGEYARGEKFTLIADPLDGTTNACHGVPFFSLSLAFYTDTAEFAFVQNLATGDTFTADTHAYLNGERIRTRESEIISLYTLSDITPFLTISKKIRNFGSKALELCFVGCGQSKAFIDVRGRGRFFDIAAGQYIVKKAGGTAGDIRGREILPHTKNFSFVASCTSKVQAKIINILTQRDANENRDSLTNR